MIGNNPPTHWRARLAAWLAPDLPAYYRGQLDKAELVCEHQMKLRTTAEAVRDAGARSSEQARVMVDWLYNELYAVSAPARQRQLEKAWGYPDNFALKVEGQGVLTAGDIHGN